MDADSSLPLFPLLLHRVPEAFWSALRQEGISCQAHQPGKPRGRFVLFDSAMQRPTGLAAEQVPIDLRDLLGQHSGDRLKNFLGTPSQSQTRSPRNLLGPENSLGAASQPDQFRQNSPRHNRPVCPGGRFGREGIDRRSRRAELLARLRAVIESHGGLWIKLSAYPFPYTAGFSLRVDHQHPWLPQLSEVLRRSAPWAHAVTHFLSQDGPSACPDARRAPPSGLQRYRQELRHWDLGVYLDHSCSPRTNAETLFGSALQKLDQAGLTAGGYATPMHPGDASAEESAHIQNRAWAAERRGLLYGSDVHLSADDWPWQLAGGQLPLLPLFPLAFDLPPPQDRAHRLSEPAESNLDTWLTATHARLSSGEPLTVCVGAQTLCGYPNVVNELLAAVGQTPNLWWTTQARWATWWRFRQSAFFQVHRRSGKCVIFVDGCRGPSRLAVEVWQRDRVCVLAVNSPILRFSADALPYQPRPSFQDTFPEQMASPPWTPKNPSSAQHEPARGWSQWVRGLIGLNTQVHQAIDDPKPTPKLPPHGPNLHRRQSPGRRPNAFHRPGVR